MTKNVINVPGAPAAVGPYSHAAKVNGMIFCSGQCGFIPETGALPEGIEAQARQALENVKTVVEGCGSDMQHVIKTTCFLKDIADFGTFNKIYAEYFTEDCPARSCVQAGDLPKCALVEVEVIAIEK